MSFKILLITHKSPLPIKDGGAYAINNIIKGYLNKNCKVDLLILSTKKHSANKEILENTYNEANIFIQKINTRINLIKNLIINIPLILKKYYSKKVKDKITYILKNNQYDFIQIEGIQTTIYLNYIKKLTTTKIIYRPHNIEYKIWERFSKIQNNIFSKFFYKFISQNLKRYEKNIINKYDILIPITEIDANFFKTNGNFKPIHVHPFGIDINPEKINDEDNNLFFIGSLDWKPNIEGLEWFLTYVWKEIKEKFSEIRFYIAGRNPSKRIKSLIIKSKAEFIGEVDDSGEFIKKHKIMIVPLFAGSGIRVKIIEAMSYGKVILTTPIGIEGIPGEHMKNIIIAENKEDFIMYLSKIYNDKNLLNIISQNAIEFIKQHYNNNKLASELIDFYKQCI